MTTERLPRIALTVGEPAGIGPDICLMLAREVLPAALLWVGDLDCLQSRATQLGLALQFQSWQPGQPLPKHQPGHMPVLHVPLLQAAIAGQLNPANSLAVLAMLDQAVDLTMQGDIDAMVTAPLHKGVINDAGIAFTGHTEYLAARTHTERVVMMLVGRGLRVALATTHLPLAAVSAALNPVDLEAILRVLQHSLRQDFGIATPRILVAGLNPHAGEGGYLGREEIEVIAPVLQKLRGQGFDLQGPLAADTLFTPKYLAQADAVLAMYHDQGLPVLKYHAFGEAVNITLGLPIVRTSVDHGTALDLAGSGRADSGSLRAALGAALEMLQHRR